MMPKFDIPNAFLDGFKQFIALGDEGRNRLIEAIKNAPMGEMPEQLSRSLASDLNIEFALMSEIIQMIFSLIRAKEDIGVDNNVFADGIIEALERKAGKELNIKSTSQLKEDLLRVLNLHSSIALTVKSTNLLLNRERILLDLRMIMDVRPVFNDDNSVEIQGALLLHTLKINYREGMEEKEIYFALDKDDLRKISDCLQRAEKKETIIREKMAGDNIKIFDIK